MKKLIIFDWNGVLIADTEACLSADNEVLKSFGCKPVNIKTFRETMIIPAIEFYTRHGASREDLIKNPEKSIHLMHKHYEHRAAKVRLRKGARKLLKFIHEKNIEAIILSNHTYEGIEKQLARLGIKRYFSEVLANPKETALFSRNKSERLEIFLKKKKNNAREVIIIGDSPEEVEIGKKAGIVTVAIKDGFYSVSRLRKANPDYLIGRLDEVIKIIKAK